MASCNEPPPKEKKKMVYEGMSATELRSVLGQPEKIDTTGSVFNIDQGGKTWVQKWHYEKRTVLIINDTIKNPAL
jgi:hypothetical protein